MNMNTLKAFWKDEEGATAIEYGIIAGLMAAVLVTVFGVLGEGLETAFENIVGIMNPEE